MEEKLKEVSKVRFMLICILQDLQSRLLHLQLFGQSSNLGLLLHHNINEKRYVVLNRLLDSVYPLTKPFYIKTNLLRFSQVLLPIKEYILSNGTSRSGPYIIYVTQD